MQLPEIKPDVAAMVEGVLKSRSRRSSGAGQPPSRRGSSMKINASLLQPTVENSSPTQGGDGDTQDGHRSSINFQVPDQPRNSIRSGGRMTLGGLGRRLSMMRKLSKPTPRTEPAEEKIELPEAPRFLSLLSPEAQYAAMKCYEDLLFDHLLKTSPEYSNVWERTPSPDNLTTKTDTILYIKDKPEDDEADKPGDREDDAGYASDTDSEKSAAKSAYLPLTSAPRLLSRSATDIKPRLPPLSREKKLLMSYRFQCAFDILDALKLKEGHLVTSPRVQSAYFDPVRNFATWHHNWHKEFKIMNKRGSSARI